MPVSKNLRKVTNNISKSSAALHVRGRNFQKLNRATLRDRKLNNKKSNHIEQKENELMIVKYIQEEVNQVPEKEVFGLDEMKAYIENFVCRFDKELDQLRQQRRPGRPQSSRQQILEEKVKHDKNLFRTGQKIPAINDRESVKKLRTWDGSIGGSTAFKYIHVSKDMQQLPIKEEDMN